MSPCKHIWSIRIHVHILYVYAYFCVYITMHSHLIDEHTNAYYVVVYMYMRICLCLCTSMYISRHTHLCLWAYLHILCTYMYAFACICFNVYISHDSVYMSRRTHLVCTPLHTVYIYACFCVYISHASMYISFMFLCISPGIHTSSASTPLHFLSSHSRPVGLKLIPPTSKSLRYSCVCVCVAACLWVRECVRVCVSVCERVCVQVCVCVCVWNFPAKSYRADQKKILHVCVQAHIHTRWYAQTLLHFRHFSKKMLPCSSESVSRGTPDRRCNASTFWLTTRCTRSARIRPTIAMCCDHMYVYMFRTCTYVGISWLTAKCTRSVWIRCIDHHVMCQYVSV